MSRTHSRVAPSAEIGDHVVIHPPCEIGRRVVIGDNTVIKAGSRIERDATIGEFCFIGEDVHIGTKVRINAGALILNDTTICPAKVVGHSSDARKLEANVSVGEAVYLHDEVELGNYAIVPTQNTIATLGNLGSKRRVITIYGSDDGPKYCIGCQIGVSFPIVKQRVLTHEVTSEVSASMYTPFLPALQEIGKVVQQAYRSEHAYVAEIKAMRKELGLPLETDPPRAF